MARCATSLVVWVGTIRARACTPNTQSNTSGQYFMSMRIDADRESLETALYEEHSAQLNTAPDPMS